MTKKLIDADSNDDEAYHSSARSRYLIVHVIAFSGLAASSIYNYAFDHETAVNFLLSIYRQSGLLTSVLLTLKTTVMVVSSYAHLFVDCPKSALSQAFDPSHGSERQGVTTGFKYPVFWFIEAVSTKTQLCP